MLFSEELQHEFEKCIENIVLNEGIGYIDAVLESCEEYDVDPTFVAKFLSKPLKEKIESEGREYNMFSKNTSKLPI
jgi:hypothetical protein